MAADGILALEHNAQSSTGWRKGTRRSAYTLGSSPNQPFPPFLPRSEAPSAVTFGVYGETYPHTELLWLSEVHARRAIPTDQTQLRAVLQKADAEPAGRSVQ
jgi:hypothetical protein